jgi:hypothetical protein
MPSTWSPRRLPRSLIRELWISWIRTARIDAILQSLSDM